MRPDDHLVGSCVSGLIMRAHLFNRHSGSVLSWDLASYPDTVRLRPYMSLIGVSRLGFVYH